MVASPANAAGVNGGGRTTRPPALGIAPRDAGPVRGEAGPAREGAINAAEM
jgi:hypothetical protein